MNLKSSFKEFCEQNKFEVNTQQIEIIDLLDKFINQKETLFSRFLKKRKKLCFYLYGKVGVGKTMLLDFVYDKLGTKKCSKCGFNPKGGGETISTGSIGRKKEKESVKELVTARPQLN